MSNQLFKTPVPNDLVESYIREIGYKCSNYYIINPDSYKKSKYLNNLDSFLDSIKDHYYDSKKFYVERKMSYKNLITVIRQIMKKNNIKYISKINYQHSDYIIQYFVYID